MIKALREALTVDVRQSSSGSETQAFPSNLKIRKKITAQGVKTLNEGDGPGEHEDIPVVKIKDLRIVEDHYDDFGDDLSAIKASEEQLFSCFFSAPDADCESVKSYDSEDEEAFKPCLTALSGHGHFLDPKNQKRETFLLLALCQHSLPIAMKCSRISTIFQDSAIFVNYSADKASARKLPSEVICELVLILTFHVTYIC